MRLLGVGRRSGWRLEFSENPLLRGIGGVIQDGIERADDVGKAASIEQRRSQPRIGEAIPMGAGDPQDQSTQAKTTQLIGHLARGQLVGRADEQSRDFLTQVSVGKTLRQETKHQQNGRHRQHQGITETHTADPLAVCFRGVSHLVECVLGDRRIVVELLDVQETSVGGEGHLPQGRQIVQPPAT